MWNLINNLEEEIIGYVRTKKSDAILDALQLLMNEKEIHNISVSEIADTLQTAKNLSANTNVSSYTRMAMIFQACRSSSALFLNNTMFSGLFDVL